MSSSKISQIVPLAIGVVFIGAALAGLGASLLRDSDEETPAPTPAKAAQPVAVAKAPPPVEPEPEKEPEPELSEEELRRQLVRILLGRIAQTDKEFNGDWLQRANQYVKDEDGLRAYWDEYVRLGASRSSLLERAQVRSKKLLPQDPRYFVSQAHATLAAKDNTESMLITGVKENLSLALFKKGEEAEGVEFIEVEFMGNFYKKMFIMYQLLSAMAAERGQDPAPWMVECVRTLEAAIVDRRFKIDRRNSTARTIKDGTAGQSIASDLFRTDSMEREINADMLALGRIYYEGAVREVIDRRKHQYYADQAFKYLAMVYQRTHSGEALNLMREVNEIQRDYLHRLAKISWKRAQLAVAAGEVEKADESYFVATQRYLQSISQTVETRRERLTSEFAILKKEIAGWQQKKRSLAAASGG